MAIATIASALSLAGCDDGERSLRFVDLEDGAYLRGEQVTGFEVDRDLLVVTAELFLDGQRVAFAPIGPFELRWDSRQFEEKRHPLLLRVHLDDGTQLDETLQVVIDNTAPTLADLAPHAEAGLLSEVSADDNFGVDRVEVITALTAAEPIVLTRAPYSFYWPGPCGQVETTVRVFDRAGAMTERVFQIDSADVKDFDCDGHRSVFYTPDGDCNDNAPWIHPGAAEPAEGFDLNCDGRVASFPGVDADGDGVASITDGGDDCDDGQATIHGTALVLDRRALVRDGAPLLWERGAAAIADYYEPGSLFLNRTGTVEMVRPRLPEVEVTPIATGANPGSLAAVDEYVAFGRGDDVVILQRTLDTWRETGRIAGDAAVGKLVYQPRSITGGKTHYALFQAGTKVWFAEAPAGGAWTTQLVTDLGEPLAEAPLLFATQFGATAVLRTSTTAWTSTHGASGTPWRTAPVGGSGAIATAVAGSYGFSVAAVNDGSGSVLHYAYPGREGIVRPAFPGRITALTVRYPYLYVQQAGGGTQALQIDQGLRQAQDLPALVGFDTAGFGTFAGGGFVYTRSAASVAPADDPNDDKVDRDCNGYDL